MKDRIDNKKLEVKYCPTYLMITKYFTKLLQGRMFNPFRSIIMRYRPLSDILSEIPMKEHVGNRKVSKNQHENKKMR